MKIINKILRYIGYILFRPIWWLERLVPRSKNIWVFGAWYGQKYSDNSKWLYEYVMEHNPEIKVVWITKNKTICEQLHCNNKTIYMSSSIQGIWYCLRAKFILLTSTQNDVNKLFINGAKQIWLWHGMPLKKIVYCGEYVNISFLRKILNPYDTVKPYATLTSSDFFTPFLEKAFRLPDKQIWKIGLPRCDVLNSQKQDHLAIKIRKQFKNAKIYLYMPTFRMLSTMDGIPFTPFIEKFKFDEKEFVDFLEQENIVFLFKPHFVDSSVNVQIASSRFMYITDNDFDDLYVLLNSVDVLLTDYSSVYFDFLATKKNVYLLTFDYEEYTNTYRSHFFNMYDKMHGIFCYNWNDFYNKVSKSQLCNNGLEEDRIKFAQYLKGNSCEELVKILKAL